MNYLFLIIALFLSSHQRSISARKNGVFYGKNNPNITDPNIKKWIKNIHIITNQEYRAFYASIFFYSMSMIFGTTSLLLSIGFSLVIAQLTSAIASYSWQKWINLGNGLPAVDPNEYGKYELTIFNKSYWIPKFWVGKRRIWISILSSALLIGTILLVKGF